VPWSDPELSSEFFNVTGMGPAAQTTVVQSPALTSIAISGTYTTGVVVSNGYQIIAVGVTSSQAGTVTIQRFLDRAGTVPVTTTLSTPVVAATPLVVVVNAFNDHLPFASFIITVTNSSGSTVANITNFAVLLQSY
jgi:hypothetical protein